MLEYETHTPLPHMQGRHILAMEQHTTAFGILQTGDHPEQGSLARAGRTQQTDQLAIRDFQRYVPERLEGPKIFIDALYRNTHQRTSDGLISGDRCELCRHSTMPLISRVSRAIPASNEALTKAPTTL